MNGELRDSPRRYLSLAEEAQVYLRVFEYPITRNANEPTMAWLLRMYNASEEMPFVGISTTPKWPNDLNKLKIPRSSQVYTDRPTLTRQRIRPMRLCDRVHLSTPVTIRH